MSPQKSAETGQFKPGDSTRVTTIGKILRRSKLDELPQLINVFMGNMSMVGPRPEVQRWVDVYPDQWKVIHSVKPGITDPASITFRNEEQLLQASDDPDELYRQVILPKKISKYLGYVNKNSVMSDISILFQTVYCLAFRVTKTDG